MDIQNLGFSEQSWANLVRKRWRPKERKRKRTFFFLFLRKKTSPVIGNKVLQNHYESVGSWILLRRKFRFVANMKFDVPFEVKSWSQICCATKSPELQKFAKFCTFHFFFNVKFINLLYTKKIFEFSFKHKIEMYPLRDLNNGAMTVTTK